MGCGARAMVPMAAATAVLVLLLAFAAKQAHGSRGYATTYEAQQQQHLRNHGDADDSHLEELFSRWVEKHNRMYHSGMEKYRRFQIFKDNVRFIRSHNAQRKSYWMGLNKFSDLTHAEFSAQYVVGFRAGGYSGISLSEYEFAYDNVMAEPAVDWRTTGAVSGVKDQGQCGSCWTFSATGAVEGLNHILTGEMVTLSEQQILDCDSPPNHSCNGGSMRRAFEYIHENGGISTESDYPYLKARSQCTASVANATVVTIDGFQVVPSQSESSLLKAVSMNPVSVAIEATGRDFQHYQGGVFSGTCGTNLDHGVLVVGYGTEDDGSNYWIVKNSWTPYWGEGGFIRMARLGSADPRGQCGINLAPSFPFRNSKSA